MKRQLFSLLLFCIPILISAQCRPSYKHLPEEEKQRRSAEVINNAEFIFEGTPIDWESYYGPDSNQIYTIINFKMFHTYKGGGERQEKVVKVIQRGGTVGDKYIQGDRGFTRNIKYILFCNSNILPIKNNADVDNIPILNIYGNGYSTSRITFVNNPASKLVAGGLYSLYFLSIKDLYHYLSSFSNITTPTQSSKKNR